MQKMAFFIKPVKAAREKNPALVKKSRNQEGNCRKRFYDI